MVDEFSLLFNEAFKSFLHNCNCNILMINFIKKTLQICLVLISIFESVSERNRLVSDLHIILKFNKDSCC
jgi:hypothetical protein